MRLLRTIFGVLKGDNITVSQVALTIKFSPWCSRVISWRTHYQTRPFDREAEVATNHCFHYRDSRDMDFVGGGWKRYWCAYCPTMKNAALVLLRHAVIPRRDWTTILQQKEALADLRRSSENHSE